MDRWSIGKRKLALVTKVQSAQVTFRLLPAGWMDGELGDEEALQTETCAVEAV